MELSVPRPRARWAAAGGSQDASTTAPPRPTWATVRGAACWSVTGQVAGAFPGFSQQGGLLPGSRIRVTERYLLVDEGRAHGFGLPLAAIRDLAVITPESAAGKPRPLLHITYDDGRCARSFVIRPRSDRFGWSRDRFEAALHVFRLAGHEPATKEGPPSFAISWAEARRYRDENVIWSGRATAPLDPFGLRRASCDVWLTTRSLMWTGGPEAGLNRVPLAGIIDVLAGDLTGQTPTPALIAGCRDDLGGRRDLVFIFDRHLVAERNERERGSILVGFRSRGVALGAAAGLDQPWRRDWWPEAATPGMPEHGLPGGWPEPPSPTAPVRPPAPELALTRAAEAEALRLLAEANTMARELLPVADSPVPVVSLAGALAEIETAAAAGAVAAEDAARRRARLLSLSEAGTRLRALVRLCQAGQISPERLEERRLAILQPLNDLLPAGIGGREGQDQAA